MANTNHVRVGAQRWDAWYGPENPPSSCAYAEAMLGRNQYQFRAPWFATKSSQYKMLINGSQQATMDAEIAYAVAGGLKYWAFDWYSSTSTFRNAWNLYQSSAYKNNIKWCVLVSPDSFNVGGNLPISDLITYMQQPNYETVLSGRPLLFLIPYNMTTAISNITAIRAAAAAVGLNPYIAIQSNSYALATYGLDAYSAYEYSPYPPVSFAPYSALDTACQATWPVQAALGPVIPNGVTGWDPRPEREQLAPMWEASQIPYNQMSNCYLTATPAQIAAHVQSLLTWMGANPAACPANNALLYAWNECSEGGWLIPTWTAGGPDHSRLDALAPVIGF